MSVNDEAVAPIARYRVPFCNPLTQEQSSKQGQIVALRAHCVHTAHAEAGILTQEYLPPDWLHSEAAKPT